MADWSNPPPLTDDERMDQIALALEALAELRPWRAGPATEAEQRLRNAVHSLRMDRAARAQAAAVDPIPF